MTRSGASAWNTKFVSAGGESSGQGRLSCLPRCISCQIFKGRCSMPCAALMTHGKVSAQLFLPAPCEVRCFPEEVEVAFHAGHLKIPLDTIHTDSVSGKLPQLSVDQRSVMPYTRAQRTPTHFFTAATSCHLPSQWA